MKNRTPFKVAEEIAMGIKTASEAIELCREDMFEMGMLDKEFQKIATAGQLFGLNVYKTLQSLKQAEESPTSQKHQGSTPLENEQSDGGPVKTDHAKKDEVVNKKVLSKVKELLKLPEIELPSGESEGTNGESMGVDDNDISRKGSKVDPAKEGSEDEVLNQLLGLA